MNTLEPRREFLKDCARLGLVCASGCGMAATLSAGDTKPANATKLLPLRSRSYCGLECENCPLLKASVANDVPAKKDIHEKWKWKEKYGIEFDAEKVFCFGCKPDGKPRSVAVAACTTRACATDRGLESCLQCKRLAACDKELWRNWPQFQKQSVQLQQEYVSAGVFTLV